MDIRVSSGDRFWRSGTYRVAIGDGHIHGFATTLTPFHCRRLITARKPSVSVLIDLSAVRLHRDTATGVTLVHLVTPAASGADLHGALEDLLVHAIADEAVNDLAEAARP